MTQLLPDMIALVFLAASDARNYDLQNRLLFYQFNTVLLFLLLLVAGAALYLQRQTIRLLQEQAFEPLDDGHFTGSKSSRQGAWLDDETDNDEPVFDQGKRSEADDPLPSETPESLVFSAGFGESEMDSQPAEKNSPKPEIAREGLVYRFSLPPAGAKSISIGYDQGSIKTGSSRLQNNHLLLKCSREKIHAQKGGAVLYCRPGENEFQLLPASLDFSLPGLGRDQPLRFRLGEASELDEFFLEFHLYNQTPEDNSLRNLYLRLYKISQV